MAKVKNAPHGLELPPSDNPAEDQLVGDALMHVCSTIHSRPKGVGFDISLGSVRVAVASSDWLDVSVRPVERSVVFPLPTTTRDLRLAAGALLGAAMAIDMEAADLRRKDEAAGIAAAGEED